MTVRHDGREYTIQAVADKEGHRRWLELICREVRPA
jgi:SPP1 family predicted phage head-tail adaptor